LTVQTCRHRHEAKVKVFQRDFYFPARICRVQRHFCAWAWGGMVKKVKPFLLPLIHPARKAMTISKQAIIDRTVKAINLLPADKAEEISDFADFVSKRYEEQLLAQGVQQLAAESKAFDFLNAEEELYTEADLKEVYNG
jgi:hypothetical protein